MYSEAHERNRGYMTHLEADQLRCTFRANAGLPTGAVKPFGGWEKPENGQTFERIARPRRYAVHWRVE